MKKRLHPLSLALLLLLSAVTCWWISKPDRQATAESSENEVVNLPTEQAQDATEITEEIAERLSSTAWQPPAVFSETKAPSAVKPFPRGIHGNRRYHVPVSRDLTNPLTDGEALPFAKSPEDGRFHLLPAEIDRYTLLARRMVFDPTSLDGVLAGQTTRVLVPSVSDEVLEVAFRFVRSRNEHSHTLQGHVVGEETTSTVQFVYHDGIVHGHVARYSSGQELQYRIMADGFMMVRELDHKAMTAKCGNSAGMQADAVIEQLEERGVEIVPQQNDHQPPADTAGWRHVDVVVGYGKAAREAEGGFSQIEALIIGSIDRMSNSFANSQIVATEVILLGTIEDPDYAYPGVFPGNMGGGDELEHLIRTSDGRLDEVSDYAALLGADLVSFVIKDEDGSAGIAELGGNSSVTARTYMTNTRLTFVHELGHNLGCDHAWGDSSQDYHSRYGWRLAPPATAKVRTIMAYDWNWGDGDRIEYFANPDVSYNGAATGAVDGYNATGDTTTDPRFVSGGLSFGNDTPGFDGTNPTLGARNADVIDTGSGNPGFGATFTANRATRSAFEVLSPTSGDIWEPGSTQVILFTGGDHKDLATIDLYKGGVLLSTIASDLNAATGRTYSWTLPADLASGTDYMIRVTLNRNGGTETADSQNFTTLQEPPILSSLNINNGANSTTSQVVTLDHVASGGAPTQYRASESSVFAGASWQTYATAPSFTLSNGYADKTVYLQVRNAEGESSTVSDTIRYEETETVLPANIEVAFFDNGSVIANGDTDPSSSNGTSFGNLPLGSGGMTRVFEIRNLGEAPLTFGTATSSDTSFSVEGLPPSIAGGQSDDFIVVFKPVSGGTKMAEISFTTSDPNANPFSFTVEGIGGAQTVDPTTGKAHSPTPADNANNLPITTQLSWTPGDGSIASRLFFGTQPNPGDEESRGSMTESTFDPESLAIATTYYWRVDARSPSGEWIEGDIWSFTTEDTASSNAFLKRIKLRGAELRPKFRKKKFNYRATAKRNKRNCRLALETKHDGATAKVNGRNWNTNGNFRKIKLKKNKTRIRIRVVAEDRTKKSYRITVRRKK